MNIEGLAVQAEAKTNERLARLAAYKQSLVDELAEFRDSGGAVLEIADGQDTGDAPMLLHQGVKIDASLKPFILCHLCRPGQPARAARCQPPGWCNHSFLST